MSKRLSILICLLLPVVAWSTHLRGGQIRVVSSNGLTCQIELRVLTDTRSEIKFGEGLLDFGDGSSYQTPTIENSPTGIDQVGVVVFHIEHTYAVPGTYRLSYTEPNLNYGILNMVNSVETRFYIDSSIVLSSTGVVPSPEFPTDPIFTCPARQPYSFSTAAIDDSTSNDFFYKYELVTNPEPIRGYEIPTGLKINNDNGLITWDTKFRGEYIAGMIWVVVKIKKYSKSEQYLGYVSRAMQIIVEDSNSKISLTTSVEDSNNMILVEEGEEKKVKLILSDNDDVDTLYLDHYNNKIIDKNVSISQYDSIANDRKFKVAVLSLKTTPDIISDLPYPITFRGHSTYQTDITFLYVTASEDLPVTPELPVVTGFEEQAHRSVYPNPFRTEVYIDGIASGEVVFVNSLGEEVMRSHLQHPGPVDTSNLPPGLYFLRVTNGAENNFKVIRN